MLFREFLRDTHCEENLAFYLDVKDFLTNYNHARYLPQSLGALLAQSRPADELIVIDDASTDNSIEVIQDLVSQAPYVTFLRNEVS